MDNLSIYNFSDYNKNGEIVTYEIDGKIYKYFRYIPDNVNSNTPIYVYYKGAGAITNDTKAMVNYLNENGSNTIVLVPIAESGTGWVGQSYSQTSECMQQIIEKERTENALTNSNLVVSGFSAGGPQALDLAIQYKVNNPSDENLIVNLMDPWSINRVKVTDENKEALENIWFVCYNYNDKYTMNNLKSVPEINLILVKNDTKYSGPKNHHQNSNSIPIYDGLLDFSTGFGDLEDIDNTYVFQIYNHETGEWEEYSYDELKALIPEFNLKPENEMQQSIRNAKKEILSLKQIKCDNEFIASGVNNIISKTKSMPFLKKRARYTYDSTTKVPNIIIEKSYDIELTLIDKLNALAESFYNLASASGEFELLDKDLDSVASGLSPGSSRPSISGGVTSGGITPDPSIPGPTEDNKQPSVPDTPIGDDNQNGEEDKKDEDIEENKPQEENKQPEENDNQEENKQPEENNKPQEENKEPEGSKPQNNSSSGSSGKKPSSSSSKQPSKKPSSSNENNENSEKPPIIEIPEEPENPIPEEPENPIPEEPENPIPEEPIVPELESPITENQTEDSSSPFKTIGVLAGVGATVGAGAYATHKIIEKKKNEEDRDSIYSDYEYSDDDTEIAEEEINSNQVTPFDDGSNNDN